MTTPWSARWIPWLIGFGIVVRVRQYLANTSLWHDESFVTLNVLRTPYSALLGPLDWHEPSPPGFMAAEKIIIAAFGDSEYVLRLLPLLAGIAVLFVFVDFARQLGRDRTALVWATALMALSPKLIEHCNQVKHFTFDVLASLLLLTLAWRAWQAPPSRRLLAAWTGIAAVAGWFSYASVFVVAATSAMLSLRAVTSWNATTRRFFLAGNGVVLLSFALLAVPALRQRTGGVTAHWHAAFPNLADPVHAAGWLVRAVAALLSHFWQPLGAIIVLCIALATIAAWQERQRAALALCWLPVAFTLGASFLQWWPFGGNQHMAFIAPAILLLAAQGAEIVRSSLTRWYPRIAAAFMLVLFAPNVGAALFHLVVPRYRHELRPVIRYMQERAGDQDAVVVFDYATYAYYTGQDLRGVHVDTAAAPRVWVVTPRRSSGAFEPDVEQLLNDLHRRRPRLDAIETSGAAGYLFGR